MLTILRRSLLLLTLLVAAFIAYVASFLLRFEFALPGSVQGLFLAGLVIGFPTKAAVYGGFRLQASRWRFAGLFDLSRIALANLTASVLVAIITMAIVGPAFPRSIYVLDAALCFLATAAIPFSVRLYWDMFLPHAAEYSCTKTILIYGAGEAGLMLVKEMRSNARLATRVVGFLDDDEAKQGTSLTGVPVLGTGADATQVLARLAAERRPVSEIVIAMPSASAKQKREAILRCRAAGVPFKTLPSVSELLHGEMSPQIREVSPDDLLGREPVRIDATRIAAAVVGECVLVTGGCGSIGSELCRQLAAFGSRKLVIFDQAESEMFMLAMDLRKRFPTLDLVTEIGDVFRASRVRHVFTRHEVSVVFHAAAYKHVPLMEENIVEAIENNVLGTYNVAHAARVHGVKSMVLISTDKAINPTSIMGVTKRIAELLVSATPANGARVGSFVSVRFGNVLGSAGSVIPIFRRQIAAGGPVTVTHPHMRRYFMSISEAVQLVLQASTMGEGSEVFVLDMGEPVKVMELARNMIRLAGFVPGEDIDIQVTGMRPGEKLFEELRLDGEDILPTPHEKIRRYRARKPNPQYIARWLEHLRILLPHGNAEALKAHLLLLVPEYQGALPAGFEQGEERVRLLAAQAS